MTPSYRIKSLQQTAEHWKQRALAAEEKLATSATPHHYACLTDNPRGPDYWTQCHKDYPGAVAFYAAPQPAFEVEHVATLTLKDSQHEWDRICYVPDGEHDLYILKEIEK